MKKQFSLTPAGLQELKNEQAKLLAGRAEIAERIKVAREMGDLSENSEYQTARADQERNDARLLEIDHILANSTVIEAKAGSKKVVLGSSVKLVAEDKPARQFQIVGTIEADPGEGRISDESPIGQALLGHKVGDIVEIKTPSDVLSYKIDSID